MKLKDRADLLTQFIRQISEEQWGEIDGIFSNGATERDTLQRRTYETLRRALMAGAFQLGQPVTLRSLAAALGTSPMPVREAISRLITERALTMLPNRTVIVPRMTRGRCIELFRARQALERLTTEAACARANIQLIDTLTEIDANLRVKAAERDTSRALALNMRFHFTLYQAGQSEVILPLIETLWLQAGPFMAYALAIPSVQWTSRHHQTILVSLRSRNFSAAGQAIEQDIGETLSQLLQKADFDDTYGQPSYLEQPSSSI
jgi:DNA-binding GntR family transcriptional regulator